MATIQKSITKAGKEVYTIRVFCGRDAEGKKIIKSTSFTPTATGKRARDKEIEEFANSFEAKCLNKEIYNEKITFGAIVPVWSKEWAERNLTQSQVEQYNKTLENWIIPEIGHMKLSDINTINIQRILNRAQDEGRSPKTTRRIYTAVNSVLKYAKRMKLIHDNPCTDCELPKLKKDHSKLHYFTLEQSKRFLEALTLEYPYSVKERKRIDSNGQEYAVKAYQTVSTIPYQWQVYFTLATFTGARRSELLALVWKDVDFLHCTVDINKSVSLTKENGIIVKDTKTESGNRIITVPYVCISMLSKWKEQELMLAENKDWTGKPLSDFDNQFVFIQESGKNKGFVLHPSSCTHKFKEIIDMYNSIADEEERLPVIRLHDLRHSSATLLVASGMDIATISKRLGHAEISTTLNVYTHAINEQDQKASDMLDRLYSEPIQGHSERVTVKLSAEEKRLVECFRRAPESVQESVLNLLEGKYTTAERNASPQASARLRN